MVIYELVITEPQVKVVSLLFTCFEMVSSIT